VIFCDKNGLAIRNGGVYSHITFLQPGANHVSPIIPYGKADLMLGIDILESEAGNVQRMHKVPGVVPANTQAPVVQAQPTPGQATPPVEAPPKP